MPERVEDLLRRCTVLIGGGSQADGFRSRGTGFFIAPGQIVTAAYAVRDLPEIRVRWQRDGAADLKFSARPSMVLAGDGGPASTIYDDYPNIAILEAKEHVEHKHPCVAVDLDIPQLDDNFLTFGYSETDVVTPERLSYVGLRGTQPTIFLDLASGLVRSGMGGAALLNRRTGAVCGVLVISKDRKQPLGGLAVPWSAVDTELAGLIAANRAFHDRDRRWALAMGQQPTVGDASPRNASGSTVEDDNDQPNLLFRFYVPAERLYAAEANRVLSLFREWLITTGVPGLRQTGYRTASGEMYEFFADAPLAQSDLGEQFGDFSKFLTLCASDPSSAVKILSQRGIGLVQSSNLVTRFGRDVRRLQIDLRHERERRILIIRHSLEEELLDEGVDLAETQSSQLNALLERLVPGASAPASVALLMAPQAHQPAAPVTVNINPQIISAAKSTIIQNVHGTVNLGPQAKELLALIERFGGPDAVNLESAVYELEDAAAPPTARAKAKDRLTRFLRQFATTAKDVGVEVLEKYIEQKMGLSS